MTLGRKSVMMIIIVVALAVLPLVLNPEAEFGGADSAAQDAITENNPDYQPWFASVWQPPSGEIESLLFAIQAALGAGFLGYYIGLKKGIARDKTSDKK